MKNIDASWCAGTWCRGWRLSWAAVLGMAVLLGFMGCGGGGTGEGPPAARLGATQAARLAHQASFGPNEKLVDEIAGAGAAGWLAAQMSATGSRYAMGGDDAVHRFTAGLEYCAGAAQGVVPCWNTNFSSTPLLWDFYRNALAQPDQLRQRVAFALQQIVVVSGREVAGTYGMRHYQNQLLALAFRPYRDVLRMVALSPVMGDYLNNVNNHRDAPNENFARELLQLFSIGTCDLATDGSLAGGSCRATYQNETVRAYAYALTGWTYPAGGVTAYGCWPVGTNCRYYGGDMVPLPAHRDTAERRLLSGVVVPAGSSAPQALEAVLDSLMAHPNMAPFIGRQLIQHLVMSNPPPSYVQRVAQAFEAGRFVADGIVFGDGQRGHLGATVAAILLDEQARREQPAPTGGKLREPVLMFTGVLRALNGHTDGDALGWYWGSLLEQMVFMSPSVFNFYAPDHPVAGTALVGPAFSIHNASTGTSRLNFLSYLLYWGGSPADPSVPQARGTGVDLEAFAADADRPDVLVDRLSRLALAGALPAASRAAVIDAVEAVTAGTSGPGWRQERVRQAAYLVFAAPQYQVLP